jgi:hypothetical protein
MEESYQVPVTGRLPQIEIEPGLFTVAIHPGKIVVSPIDIGASLGYDDKNIPEHFSGMIGESISWLQSLCAIQAGYRVVDLTVPDGRKDGLCLGGTFFDLSKIVMSQLTGAEKVALFVCTIGPVMEEWRRQLETDRDEVRALFVDTVGSASVEIAAGLLHDHIEATMLEQGMNVTNRFSPGYCGWPVAEQQALFSRFPAGFCGIVLNESSLMVPIKSISGIIGIGPKAARKDYPCNRCERNNCVYRSYRKGIS